MPKKETDTEEASDKKEEILNELAEKLKEESPDEEKSGLEEDVGLDSMEFQQFMQPSKKIPTPVLERIAGSQPKPIFVGGIAQTPQTIPGETKESDDFKYVPAQGENNEPKYVESEARISRKPERVDFTRVGREPARIIPKVDQGEFFRRSESFSQPELTSEKRWAAERIDAEKAGREDPFRREEIKYEKYKPKLPKGY